MTPRVDQTYRRGAAKNSRHICQRHALNTLHHRRRAHHGRKITLISPSAIRTPAHSEATILNTARYFRRVNRVVVIKTKQSIKTINQSQFSLIPR
jgi:hypothetical protein